LDIQQLKGKLDVVKHMEGEGVDVKKRTEELNAELNEKIEELEDLETLNQNLIVKDRKANDELQDAKKELISVMCYHSLSLEDMQIRSLFICGFLQILSYYTCEYFL
jgi:predicted nuclease with TOPRIM domain